jgi:omega-amidase
MKIALTHLNQVWENPSLNFELCEKVVAEAASQGCDLVVFPEMTLTGFTSNVEKFSDDLTNLPNISNFQKIAKLNSINIIFGALTKSDTKFQNVAITVSSTGLFLCLYSKIHPFSFSGEAEFIKSGDRPVTVDIGEFRIGLSICYDLRFSDLYNSYADNCNLVINIANWPKKRIDHWRTLIRARAIENQYFVAGVNRIGVDGNNIEYEKSSFITGPFGVVIKPLYESHYLSVYEIFPEEVAIQRSTFPVLKDRRIELYKEWLS